MRLIVLTQYYPPEIGAPQNRLSDLAKRLVRMGHQVTVFTGMPNYPTGNIFDGYRGKIYVREVIDGVRVCRSWIFATESRKVLLRLLNYFSFVLSSLVLGALFLPRADFLLTESPPLFLGISGYVLAKLKRARFVLNVADLWPKAAVDLQVITSGWLIRAAERLEEFLYGKAALITAQTQGIVLHIQQRTRQKQVRLLTNGADVERFGSGKSDPALLREFGLEGRFIVGYAGLYGPAQALEKVVDAGLYLQDCPEIVIALFGDGPVKSKLQEQARERKLENIRFFPVQPQERMPYVTALWGIGLVPLYKSPLMRAALPSKMFEIMAAGVPVIMSAVPGESTALIEAAQGGICVTPENPAALAEAIKKLYCETALRLQLGRNARNYVERYYNRQAKAEQFMQYLLQLEDR